MSMLAGGEEEEDGEEGEEQGKYNQRKKEREEGQKVEMGNVGEGDFFLLKLQESLMKNWWNNEFYSQISMKNPHFSWVFLPTDL